ncbi:hypothetical protein B0H16DRAFT_1610283 [Mycena metata]|uniref:DUF7029 domain-containing protein n=1 Tax=Mycena metata TaxID=1033252 RepID=A0AAD7MIK5_9AGAR|nr:hypothetical protein B0H16DRAFT_1610283 [Mycena metata]
MHIGHRMLLSAAGAALASFVLASPAILRSDGSSDSNLPSLHPALHPDHDTSDLNHLKANNDSSLYYSTPSADAAGNLNAAIMQLTHLYPAISLEHSRYIRSVTCNPTSTSISVTFTDTGAFQTAASDWTAHSQLLLITYSAGCGAGITSQERSFHLVSNIQASRTSLRITATIDTIPFHETFHEDQELTFQVASYSIGHRASPPSRRAPPAVSVANIRESKLEDRDFFDFLSDAVSQVANAALVAVNAAGDALISVANSLTSWNLNPTAGFSFDTATLLPFDSSFNGSPAYQLSNFTETDPNTGITGSLVVYCVSCEIAMQVNFVGSFVGSLTGGFTTATIQVIANSLSAEVVLGMQASITYSLPSTDVFDKEAPIPGAGFAIPGVFALGTFIDFAVEVGFELSLSGTIAVGYDCAWSGVGGTLDMVTPSNSAIIGDWSLDNNCVSIHPPTTASAAFNVSFTPAVAVSTKLEVSILPGITPQLTADIALVEEISMPFEIQIDSSGSDGCSTADIEVGYSVKLESQLYVEVTGLPHFILGTTPDITLVSGCFPFGFSSSRRDLEFDVVPRIGASPDLTSRISSPANPGTTIVWTGEPYELSATADGSVTVTPTANSTTVWRSDGNLTFATSDGLGFHTPASTATKGFGPLLLADDLPAGTHQIVLGTPPGRHYLAAVDGSSGAFYYLAFCNYADNTSLFFLIADINTGLDALVQDQAGQTPAVANCGTAALTQQFGAPHPPQ